MILSLPWILEWMAELEGIFLSDCPEWLEMCVPVDPPLGLILERGFPPLLVPIQLLPLSTLPAEVLVGKFEVIVVSGASGMAINITATAYSMRYRLFFLVIGLTVILHCLITILSSFNGQLTWNSTWWVTWGTLGNPRYVFSTLAYKYTRLK